MVQCTAHIWNTLCYSCTLLLVKCYCCSMYSCVCLFVWRQKNLFLFKKTTKSSVSAQHARSHARKMQWIHPANLSPHKAHSTLVLYMCYYKKYCTCAVMHSNTFTPYLVNSVCCGSLYGNNRVCSAASWAKQQSRKHRHVGTGSTNAREVELTFQARK